MADDEQTDRKHVGDFMSKNVSVIRSGDECPDPELQQVREALRLSEERYRTFFESNIAGTFLSTPQGRILACNKALAQIFGYDSPEEVLQRHADSLLTESDNRQRLLDAIRSQGAVQRYERVGRRTDGKQLSLVESAVGIFDGAGELVQIVGFVMDETARRQAEEGLCRAQGTEVVGKLSGGIAHDFNNILAVILGYSELLSGQLESGNVAAQQVEQIRKAVERGSGLTRQLLAFSRQQFMRPIVLNLNNAIVDMEQVLRRLVGQNIELLTRLAPGIANVKLDPSQIEQVLLNLIVNARDAMPAGGKLTIDTADVNLDAACVEEAHGLVASGEYVMLAVSDTGVGINRETLRHIFEPFFTTKERGKGTGLGLFTVYGIVKQSNGFILAYSEPGEGTTFKVYFPAVPDPLHTAVKSEPALLATGSETVLLVEDSDQLRELAADALASAGYKVIEAAHANAALLISQSRSEHIHMLVTNVVMPGLNGHQLAARLTLTRSDLRVLYISGYTHDQIVHRGVSLGGVDFLQKPFTRAALTRKVREILDRKSQGE